MSQTNAAETLGKGAITIGMATYNGEKYIAQALDSLLQQDYPDKTIVISDNGSTDGTEAICREAAAARPDLIRYVRHPENRGAIWNFQFLLDRCDTPYFMWAADHDYWSGNCVSECVAALDRHDDAVLSYPDVTAIDDKDVVIPEHCSPDRWSTVGGNAVERFRTFMWKRKQCSMLYGVFRMSAVKNLKLRPMLGMDNIFLADIQLAGAFVFVPTATFFFRGRRETREDMWHRQSGDLAVSSGLSPASRVVLEYIRSVWRKRGLTIRERLHMTDDIVWSLIMRDHENLKRESRPLHWILHSTNRIVAPFRRRPVPW